MDTLRDLVQYIRIYRRHIGRRLYIVFALTALAALAEGFGIALLLPLLRASEAGSGSAPSSGLEGALFDLLAWMGLADSMGGILVFIGVMFLLKGGIKFAQGSYRGYLQAQLLRELKAKLFDAYSRMDYRYYLERNTGHFINVINGQVGRFFSSFSSFAGLFSTIITTVSYFAVAFALTWEFATMALVFGLMILVMSRRLNDYVSTL